MIAVIYSNKMPPRHNRQGSQTELWTTVSMIRKNRRVTEWTDSAACVIAHQLKQKFFYHNIMNSDCRVHRGHDVNYCLKLKLFLQSSCGKLSFLQLWKMTFNVQKNKFSSYECEEKNLLLGLNLETIFNSWILKKSKRAEVVILQCASFPCIVISSIVNTKIWTA